MSFAELCRALVAEGWSVAGDVVTSPSEEWWLSAALVAPESFCGKSPSMKRQASPASRPASSRLGFENTFAVLAGLALAGCDKNPPPQATPEPVATEAQPVAPEAKPVTPEAKPDATDTAAIKPAAPPTVAAKEVPAATPSAAAPSAPKASASAKAQAGSCAPGGCAPGKCGGSKH